jgi:hypothetical protein
VTLPTVPRGLDHGLTMFLMSVRNAVDSQCSSAAVSEQAVTTQSVSVTEAVEVAALRRRLEILELSSEVPALERRITGLEQSIEVLMDEFIAVVNGI